MKTFSKLIAAALTVIFASAVQAQEPVLVKDINPGLGSYPAGMIAFQSKTYFSAEHEAFNSELWVTDGTDAGTQLFKEINPTAHSYPHNFTVCGDKLFFIADDGTHGEELWVTDGTSIGTRLVKDIYPGSLFSVLTGFAVLNNKLYFGAYEPTYGYELWVSDGTAAGTFAVTQDAIANTDVQNITAFNGALYFTAQDNTGYHALWKSDGTASGTTIIRDKVYAGHMTAMGGDLYFGGADESPAQDYALWKISGSSAQVQRIKTVYAMSNRIVVLNNKLIFSGNSGGDDAEPWISDGTTGGTHVLKDVVPGPGNGCFPTGFTLYKEKVYFHTYFGPADNELWVTDGTEAGTVKFAAIDPRNEGDHMAVMQVYNNKLYLVGSGANTSQAYQLWEIDGDTAGTRIVAPAIAPHPEPCENTAELNVCNGSLYYKATYNASIGRELYKITTAPTGITAVKGQLPCKLYPNPAKDFITIEISDPRSGISIVVTDVYGKIVKRETSTKRATHTFNTSDLVNGMYFLKMTAGDNIGVRSFVVRR